MLFYAGTLAQSCKEGSVKHDYLGQRRTCRGGKWSAPCRVRREWNGMLPGERWVDVTVQLQREKTPLFPWPLGYLLTCKWSTLPSYITSGIFSLVNIHEKEEEFKHNRNWKTPLEYDVSHKKKNKLKLRNPSS